MEFMKDYAHPEVLVDTQWVVEHLNDPKVRIVDTHIDPAMYESGHIPGAVLWNGVETLLTSDWRINFDKKSVEDLCGRSGIDNDTTVIAYSDHNAFAPWVFWFLKSVGHADVRVLNGGRKKWIADGHALTTELPTVSAATYIAHDPNPDLRALQERVRAAVGKENHVLLDVRTPEEYRGELFLLEPPQETERAGHIPGATHLYYEAALNEDDTFKSADALAALYADQGITADKETITYCAVGIRSAHTWFVLTQLLGYPYVRSFDASWNLWGRLPDTPIERGEHEAEG
jgi:thiosulfate/3-mercaptopyruvate sulfurtransferase